MLIQTVNHGGIRFRYHAFGADIIAKPKRNGSIEWSEVRRKPGATGILMEYLVKLAGDDLNRAMVELIISGADQDERNPVVQKSLQTFKEAHG